MARNPPRISSYRRVSPSGRCGCTHVLESHDVVFSKVRTGLYLDDLQRNGTGIFQAMAGTDRDVGGLVSGKQELFVVTSDPRGPLTTIQCSARWWCICRDSDAPGVTVRRFTWKRSPLSTPSNDPRADAPGDEIHSRNAPVHRGTG